jgi:hypothetical protein
MARRLIPLALFAALALAALTPFRSYDSFWHLATGRWIVEHRALPLTDPFAVASDRIPWINGEWLFEIVFYAIQSLGGLAALSWFRALVAALTFTLAYFFARRDSEPPVALALSCVAFAGAMATFDARPSAVAALLVVLAIGTQRLVPYVLLTIVWINVHPSALIAPAIPLARRRLWIAIASGVALLVNPYGWRAIVAPLTLMSAIGSGEFVNIEWVASSPVLFPLVYVLIAIGLLVFGTTENWREHLWRILLFAAFAWLAARHVRHQTLFFAAFPMLVAPAVRRERIRPALAYGTAIAAVLFIAITTPHATGPAPSRFPIASVARLKATGLRGNVYNPDQFGGYLIWSFYPERRALTDGRNELHHTFIREFARARGDERAWRALLRRHDVVLAVDEYRPPIPVVNAVTRESRLVPASLAYWPRREWALIGYDDVSMVFAKRSTFGEDAIGRWELRGVVPDAAR